MPVYLEYGLMRMTERKVTKADVESVLTTEVKPPRPARAKGGTVRTGFAADGKLLEVVLTQHGEVLNVLWPE